MGIHSNADVFPGYPFTSRIKGCNMLTESTVASELNTGNLHSSLERYHGGMHVTIFKDG